MGQQQGSRTAVRLINSILFFIFLCHFEGDCYIVAAGILFKHGSGFNEVRHRTIKSAVSWD